MRRFIVPIVACIALAAPSVASAHDETQSGNTFCGSLPGVPGAYWQSPSTGHWWRDWWTGAQFATNPSPINTSGYTRWQIDHEIQHEMFWYGVWRGSYRSNRFCGFWDLPHNVSPAQYGMPVR